MKRSLIIACCLAMLAGCASSPLSPTQADRIPSERHILYKVPTGNTVPVTITRDSGFMYGACATRVYVNGAIAAYVRQGETVTLYMPPGEKIFGVEADGICGGGLVEIEKVVTSGRALRYRIGYDNAGAIGLHPTAR